MKSVIFKKFGGVDVLELIESERSDTVSAVTRKKGEVLIRVKACSLNPLDWKIRNGTIPTILIGSHFPKAVGIDFAGIIEEIDTITTNDDSTDRSLKVGDEVFGCVDPFKGGALSEYVSVPISKVWLKPKQLTFSQASTIPIAGGAAYTTIELIQKVFPNNISTTSNTPIDILVNGATGGYGMFFIQLARVMMPSSNVHITAVASTAGVPYATKWGADVVIDYHKQNILELKDDNNDSRRYDVILDLSGKLSYNDAKVLMKDTTTSYYLDPSPTPLSMVLGLATNLWNTKQIKPIMSESSQSNIQYIVDAINDEKLTTIEISKSFPLEQYKEAYEYAAKGGVIGKVTIEIE